MNSPAPIDKIHPDPLLKTLLSAYGGCEAYDVRIMEALGHDCLRVGDQWNYRSEYKGVGGSYWHKVPRLTAELDAMAWLCGWKLPGRQWSIGGPYPSGMYRASMATPIINGWSDIPEPVYAATAPLAWAVAFLKTVEPDAEPGLPPVPKAQLDLAIAALVELEEKHIRMLFDGEPEDARRRESMANAIRGCRVIVEAIAGAPTNTPTAGDGAGNGTASTTDAR